MRYLSFVLVLLLVVAPFTVAVSAADAAVLPEAAETLEVFVALEGGGLAEAALAVGGAAEYAASSDGAAAIAAARAELDAVAEAAAALGGELLGQSWYLSRSLGVRIAADRLEALSAIPGVASVELIGRHFAPSAEETGEAMAAVGDEAVYAPDLLGLDALHREGLRGDGILAAVIDTGFDVDHPVFRLPAGSREAAVLTTERLAELLPLTVIGHRDFLDAEQLYVSDKLPLVYDYVSGDADVSTQNMHGTHVASILGGGLDGAGNFVGAAPGAQLLLLKVFSDGTEPTGSDYAIYCAVEDAMVLGADVINLSLGISAGYPYATNTFSLFRHLERARELGCAVVCAAGNDGAVGAGSAYDTAREIDFPLAANPDYGLVSDPASYADSIAIGAYIPDRVVESGLGTVSGLLFPFNDTAAGQDLGEMTFVDVLAGQTLAYVPVPGLGEPADYAGLDVAGKLALVARGTITFAEKLQYAAEAGAVGMICYDNVESTTIFGMAFDAMAIPAISVTAEDGARLLDVPADERYIFVDTSRIRVSTPDDAGQPAEFSSRASGLTIRPTVAAPGRIYAAIPDGGYQSSAGTSMATPAAAGLIAVAMGAQKGEDRDTAALDALLADLITTASPILDESGHPYAVRVQGAGRVDGEALLAAMAGETAQLRAEDGRALIELGDGLGETFTFTADLTNRSAVTATYLVSASVGSDDYFLLDEEGTITAFAADRMRVFADAVIKVDGMPCNRYADRRESAFLTLAPGETRRLTVTVAISPETAKRYAEYFTHGYYLEGYLWVEQGGGETLSMPYLGFVGDFDAVPYLDTFSYDGGVSFFAQNFLIADARGTLLNLGCNFYDENTAFYRDTIAFSPDGDGWLDRVQLGLNPLRNLYSMDILITDEAGEEVSRGKRNYYIDKAYLGEDELLTTKLLNIWDGSDPDHSDYILPDGRYTATFRVYAHGDEVVEEVSLPLVLDTKPVELVRWSVREEGGRRLLYVTLADEHYPMRAILYCDAIDQYGRELSLYRDAHNITYREGRRSVTLAYDITDYDGDHLYLDLYDYALNFETHRLVLGN